VTAVATTPYVLDSRGSISLAGKVVLTTAVVCAFLVCAWISCDLGQHETPAGTEERP